MQMQIARAMATATVAVLFGSPTVLGNYEDDLRQAELKIDEKGLPLACSGIEESLDSVIAQAPVGTQSWENAVILQANCFRRQNQLPDASAILNESLAKSPKNLRLQGMLGIVFADQGRFGEAIPLLRGALSVRATRTVRDSLALSLYGAAASKTSPESVSGRNILLSEAATHLLSLVSESAASVPDRAGYQMRLAQVLNAQGKTGEALELAALVLRESEGKVNKGTAAEFNMTFGQMCYANGRQAEGLMHMDRAMALAPTAEFKRTLGLLKEGTINALAGAGTTEVFQQGDRVVIPED